MSGSLLLIAAVWLVLLAPLLLRNQRPVRRTAPALNNTRVLHEGGAPLRGKRKLRPTDTLYHPDVDDDLELLDAEPEYVLIEDDGSGSTSSRDEKRGAQGAGDARAARDARSGRAWGRLGAAGRKADKADKAAKAGAGKSAQDTDIIETVDAVEIMEPESAVRRRATGASADSVAMSAAYSSNETSENIEAVEYIETVEAVEVEVVPEADGGDARTDSDADVAGTAAKHEGRGEGADIDGANSADAADAAAIVDGEVVDDAAEDDAEGNAEAENAEADSTEGKSTASTADSQPTVAYKGHDDTDTGEFAPVNILGKLTHRLRPRTEQGAGEAVDVNDRPEDADSSASRNAADELHERRQRRYDSVPAAYLRGGDVHAHPDVVDSVDEPQTTAVDFALAEESDEPSADDLAYVNSRRGRGVYDPVASWEREQQRLRRRKQVLMVLGLTTVISFVLAFILGGAVWWAPVISLAFSVFYLVVLRKQAIEEQKLRHRRMARMRRARLGVRNTEDDELGVPDRLQRPGAIIMETDDADPEFQHLDYIDGAEFFGDPAGPADSADPADPGYSAGRAHGGYYHPDEPIFDDDEHGRPTVVRRHFRAV
ncbi:hypothetical protein LA329_04665 [Corynebacterium falsenii]|uniref:divisome protein SepX/GlpR n=1 Tax=Corynebacterium falsenii TaxID=108486 RepID=UPI001CCE3B9C|nr:gephyrin-like molybdotransferase receptor GlpR [Corynebacterium falsenii]UBI07599.1 hypothetical protein LA329_04665 [Corynebacterium falsenii]